VADVLAGPPLAGLNDPADWIQRRRGGSSQMNIDMLHSTYLGHGPTTAASVPLAFCAECPPPSDAWRPVDSGGGTAPETPVSRRQADAVAALVGRAGVVTGYGADFTDLVDEWGRQSFPASDPPANW